MRRTGFLALSAAATAFFAVAANAPAAAQDEGEPSASEVALAREQFRLGITAAREERWTDAREAFARSYGLAPRPITLLNLAGAQVRVGRLVQAAESYRRFLREAREGRAAEQRDAAIAALDDVEGRIARVRIEIRGLADSDRVTLDGESISAAAIGAELPVDPGARVIAVFRDGRRVLRESVTVAEGERRAVPLVVRAPPPRIGNGNDGLGLGRDRDRDDEGGGVFTSPWFWTILGVIVVGATVGALVVFAGPTEDPFMGSLGTRTLE